MKAAQTKAIYYWEEDSFGDRCPIGLECASVHFIGNPSFDPKGCRIGNPCYTSPAKPQPTATSGGADFERLDLERDLGCPVVDAITLNDLSNGCSSKDSIPPDIRMRRSMVFTNATWMPWPPRMRSTARQPQCRREGRARNGPDRVR